MTTHSFKDAALHASKTQTKRAQTMVYCLLSPRYSILFLFMNYLTISLDFYISVQSTMNGYHCQPHRLCTITITSTRDNDNDGHHCQQTQTITTMTTGWMMMMGSGRT